MNFCSDNTTSVSPEIMDAMVAANSGQAMAYGEDAVTERVTARLGELFETEVAVCAVTTGTAANALALSVMSGPYGAIYCHREAHIAVDECGAPEFYTGGAKLMPLDGPNGKLDVETLTRALAESGVGDVHRVQPTVVSITQASECGTVYSVPEIAALSEEARRHGLGLHMDGARFANAVARLGCAPADLTWRAGVDVLSFGATKNGALAAEAVVVFTPGLARELEFRRKRAGHLLSKMRFISVQLESYIADNLWLRNAAHANELAAAFAHGLADVPGAELLYPVEANEIFVHLPEPIVAGLRADGFSFLRFGGEGAAILRLVTAFNTRVEDVEAFIAAAQRHANPQPDEHS